MMMRVSWWFRSSVVVGLCQGLVRSMLGCGWFIYGVGANPSQVGRLDGIQKKVLMKCLHVVVTVPKEVAQVERLCLRRLIATKRVLPQLSAQSAQVDMEEKHVGVWSTSSLPNEVEGE